MIGAILLLLVVYALWRCINQASFTHRVRKQQRDLLELQRRQIELGWKWAQVSDKALDRDLKALEVEELERKWHDSDYRGMA
jgi:hypothetical protein